MELLAPAGTLQHFYAALEGGADAIYLGGKVFNARSHAGNFEYDELKEALRVAHILGVSIFVTVNIIVGDKEMKDLANHLRKLEELGVDGIIVQDLGVAMTAKRVAPKLELHGSTQMTANNLSTVRFLERLGFSRVVVSREMSLEDIRRICSGAKAEIEVFIHGALCISYSGQCLMSSYIGGRSGNRGSCAQPCRLPYTLLRNGHEEVTDSSYIMSPKDLNYSDYMGELEAMGVASCKVEGRMKQIPYVRQIIGAYRDIIDGHDVEGAKARLNEGFNRGFSAAYLEDKGSKAMMTVDAPNNRAKLAEHETKRGLQDFSRKYKVYAFLDGAEGSSVSLTLMGEDGLSVTVHDDYTLQLARKTPTPKEKIEEQIGRLGNTLFTLESLTAPEGNYMWPSSVLNSLRRDAVEALEEAYINRYETAWHERQARLQASLAKSEDYDFAQLEGLDFLQVQVDELEALETVLSLGVKHVLFGGDRLSRAPYAADVWHQAVTMAHDKGAKIIFGTPRVIRETEYDKYRELLRHMVEAQPDGMSIHFLGALEDLHDLGYRGAVFGDTSLQTFNSTAVDLLTYVGLSGVMASEEATLSQMRHMAKTSTIGVGAVVQGRVELMISEYCAISSFAGTGEKKNCPAPCLKDEYALLDRKGEQFPIKTDPFCRMHILNSKELDMRSYIPDLMRSQLAFIRIDGRQQSKKWLDSRVGDYQAIMSGTKNPPPKDAYEDITRGHYFRGIFE